MRLDSNSIDRDPGQSFVDAEFDWIPYSARALSTENGKSLFIVGRIDHPEIVVKLEIRGLVDVEPRLSEMEVVWSACGPKCALYLWGRAYVVVDLESGAAVVELVKQHASESIHAGSVLRDLPLPKAKQSMFCHVRALHWQARARALGENPTPLTPPEEATQGFLVSGRGSTNLYGVFEQHHDTGDLYVYDPERGEILGWLQLFADASKLALSWMDVAVVWSKHGERVGVVICGGLRGVIDIPSGQKARSEMYDRFARPISHPEWLAGFDWWERRSGVPRPVLPRVSSRE